MKTYSVVFLAAILLCTACNSAKKDYNAAKKENTIEAFIYFIEQHPEQNTLIEEAEIQICELEFKEIYKQGSVDDFLNFQKKHLNDACSKNMIHWSNIFKEKLFSADDHYITLFTKFDEYGRKDYAILKNIKGEDIAELNYTYKAYNFNTLDQGILTDMNTKEVIHTVNYDLFRRAEKPKYLCLNYNGDIIYRNDTALLVQPFDVIEIAPIQEIAATFQESITNAIFPCQYCSDSTSIQECLFMWRLGYYNDERDYKPL